MKNIKLLSKPKLSALEIAQRRAKIIINSRYYLEAVSEFTLYNVEKK